MIVSGDKVMMLDPSKRYIPFKDRVAVLLKFSDVKRQEHSLDGTPPAH